MTPGTDMRMSQQIMLTTAATMKTEEKNKMSLVHGTVQRTGSEGKKILQIHFSCTKLPFLSWDHHGKAEVDQGIKIKSNLVRQLKEMWRRCHGMPMHYLYRKPHPGLASAQVCLCPGGYSVHQWLNFRRSK